MFTPFLFYYSTLLNERSHALCCDDFLLKIVIGLSVTQLYPPLQCRFFSGRNEFSIKRLQELLIVYESYVEQIHFLAIQLDRDHE